MSLKQGRYDILQENRNIGDTIWTHFINHNQNLNLMSRHNMTGENVPFTSGERAHINYEGSLRLAKKPYEIGIGALFLWLVFVFLIVTVLWQDNKIEFLKKELKLMRCNGQKLVI